MEEISAFTDKTIMPDDEALEGTIGKTYLLWNTLREYIHSKYSKSLEEWKYSGVKYGWNFRIKDKKRVLIYFLPRMKFFKVAFVFGQKATDTILKSNVSKTIKDELTSAKIYAEGRGIRIDVNKNEILEDIKLLIDIKLQN